MAESFIPHASDSNGSFACPTPRLLAPEGIDEELAYFVLLLTLSLWRRRRIE